MDTLNKQREGFSTKIGIIAAVSGSAVGLGNIWKFPYVAGQYGGGAFLIVYLICIMVLGVPILLSEFIIGRRGQKNAIGSFRALSSSSMWPYVGWIGFITAFIILAFYSVVAGWILYYIQLSVSNSFISTDLNDLKSIFECFVSQPIQPIIYQVIFMIFTAWIILKGARNGIERFSKLLMPVLVAILILLAIRSVTLPGSSEGLSFLFNPDFSKINSDAILAALGQAFF